MLLPIRHINFFVVAMLLISSCDIESKKKDENLIQSVDFDLEAIKKRGKIILLTENSQSTYFLYRNQIRGFDYELIRAFAKHLGVKVEVKLLDDVDRMFHMLNSGEGDIIASNLTITKSRLNAVNFTTPVYQTRQVLAQRKFSRERPDSVLTLIQDTLGLNQIPIWVHRYSSFYERLKEIEKNTGKLMLIHEAPGEISTDDLLRLTNEGEIPSTITDENLALMATVDYSDLDFSLPLTEKQNIAWAVRKNASQLQLALNTWLEKKATKSKLSSTFEKYFGKEILERPNMAWSLPQMSPGAISPYDSLFKMYAPEIGWDWRMLAALSFQESRFNPNARSWSGASGLMQLMPETAIRFGCDSTPSPDCSVKAGVKYLKYLQGMWRKRVPNPEERNKFILASYNVGQGHIIDAQNLARELGMQDTIWDGHVAEALLLKQQEKYYNLPVVKHGYCHAKEPYHFVGKILAIFEHYKSSGN